jgi:hypothetical protein
VSPSASSYNGWNPFLFWILLDRLADSDNARFFHNHEYDPGYAQWRAEADRRARSDADLRAKLDDLDAKLAAQQSDPRDPHYLPSGVTPESAHASAQINEASETSSDGGGGGLFLVAVILVFGIAFLEAIRRAVCGKSARPDGKLYDRVWSPGTSWIEPPRYVERREGADTSTASGVMMLYGAATGVADPAPQFEYILVSSFESEGGGAFVAIHAGIDVNPAGLSLT